MSARPSFGAFSLRIARAFAAVFAFAFTAWIFGALCFDGPGIWLAALAMLCLLAVMIWQKFRWRAWAVWGVCTAATLIWWLSLKPPAVAAWQPDVAHVPAAEIDGDIVTFHNVRDFEYRSATDFTPRWTTREVRLSSITGVDIAINYWGSPWMAHPIVSFQFSDSPPLAFSIETRKRAGQAYSAIGGLYRQYPLIFIVAEERDVMRVRTNYRKGEDVYLYRTSLTPDQARQRFREYLASINQMREKPRWYNAVTTNCTTSIRNQHPSTERPPWDWRMLLNGKMDEMLYDLKAIRTARLPFPELKQRSLINPAAKAAGDDPRFSELIRAGHPGYCEPE
jgi:hypothetical protein